MIKLYVYAALLICIAACGKDRINTEVVVVEPEPRIPWSPEVEELGKTCPAGTKIGCRPLQMCRCYKPGEI